MAIERGRIDCPLGSGKWHGPVWGLSILSWVTGMIVQPNDRFHVRPPRQDCRQHPKCCHVITAWGICGSSMLNKTALMTENSWLEATEKWGPAGLGPHDWHICETQVVRQFSHSLDLGWALVFPKNRGFHPISPKVYHHIPCQILYNIRGVW